MMKNREAICRLLTMVLLLVTATSCSTVKQADVNKFAEATVEWLKSDSPHATNLHLFADAEDIMWLCNKYDEIRVDINERGGAKAVASEIESDLPGAQKYCIDGFIRAGVDPTEFQFAFAEFTMHKKWPKYEVTVYLSHPKDDKKHAIGFSALVVAGKLKITDPHAIMQVHFGR